MVQLQRVDDERLLRREHREVRIPARLNAALRGQAGERSRPHRHPLHHLLQPDPALPRLRPDQRQAQLQRRHSAPRHSEVPVLQVLQVGRAGRMVGHNAVDGSVQQPLPEPLPVAFLPDRRAALERGGPVRNLLGSQREVVRTGLHRHRHPFRPGRSNHGQRPGVGQVQDVHPRTRAPRGVEHQRDRPLLRLRRPGRQEPGVTAARRGGRGVEHGRILGVDDHQRPQPGQLGQVPFQLLRVQVRKLVHARMHQEALEPEHPGLVQRRQLGGVARDGPAPEPHIHERLRCGHLLLGPQRRHRHRGRNAVQRHVDQGGHPAGRRRPGRGREPLPLGAAGLVDVHVRVHQAGQQRLVPGQLQHPGAVEPGPQRLDGGNHAAGDAHLNRNGPGAGQHGPAADHQVEARAARHGVPSMICRLTSLYSR